jgi:hypothetical protein
MLDRLALVKNINSLYFYLDLLATLVPEQNRAEEQPVIRSKKTSKHKQAKGANVRTNASAACLGH